MVAEQEKKKQGGIPEFRPGDTVRVSIKVVEGDSERLQVFEGTVISRRGHGEAASFTVRKISFGVGVERTFPLFSPHIEGVQVVKSGKVRRSRLYYLRSLSGKAARVDELETGDNQPKPASGSSPSQQASEKALPAGAEAPKPAKAEKKAKASEKAEPGAQAAAAAPARK